MEGIVVVRCPRRGTWPARTVEAVSVESGIAGWRRGWDSKPRGLRPTVFKTAPLNRSGTPPRPLFHGGHERSPPACTARAADRDRDVYLFVTCAS